MPLNDQPERPRMEVIADNASRHLPQQGGHFQTSVAEDLKALRKTLNLTQKAFAARFGIPLPSIQNWESAVRTSRPDATATLLLQMIESDPDGVAALVARCRTREKGLADA